MQILRKNKNLEGKSDHNRNTEDYNISMGSIDYKGEREKCIGGMNSSPLEEKKDRVLFP